MAEPVGITGTAAGLVSLGLQLYGEISKYIDAVKGRKRDLATASRHAETLRICLTAIDDVVSSNNNSKAAEDAVDSCMLSCKDEVKELEALITRLRGPISTTPDTFSAKIKEKGRQLSYPFHRESVLMLERRLDSTNGVLRTALHSLELNVSIKTRDTVVRLQSDLAAIEGASQARDAKLTDFGTSIHTIGSSSSRVENLVTGVHEQTTTISLMAAEHNGRTILATAVSGLWKVHGTPPVHARLLRRILELRVPVNTASSNWDRTSVVSKIIDCGVPKVAAAASELFEALARSQAEGESLFPPNIGASADWAVRVLYDITFFPTFAKLIGYGPLAMAIFRQDLPAMIQLLQMHPSSINLIDHDGHTPVHLAVSVGNLPMLKLVLKHSSTQLINTPNSSSLYPLDYAVAIEAPGHIERENVGTQTPH
ncbi:hypothetical protein Cob_v005491 [Colletotrichum orbiculare MAFF 240422]|uniref:Uncharacterized protein n=1 Tax=Colletotrichum orbiculare (strain 104-T / ATCC 96160 / CBS 514.97 / LARS 414 / MAFF 240422) TaxID=1213857 RepID=A0A484FT53_COLOR|nr:hypothetical protein Cob_v005491 [Colletotrichum orbiculare MAFF 240422]